MTSCPRRRWETEPDLDPPGIFASGALTFPRCEPADSAIGERHPHSLRSLYSYPGHTRSSAPHSFGNPNVFLVPGTRDIRQNGWHSVISELSRVHYPAFIMNSTPWNCFASRTVFLSSLRYVADFNSGTSPDALQYSLTNSPLPGWRNHVTRSKLGSRVQLSFQILQLSL